MKRQIRLVVVLAAGLLSTFWLAAAPVAAQGEARVRLIHGSGDTPPVDVYLDGERAVTALAFTQASAYLPVTTGRHTFQVFVSGVRPGAGRPLTVVEGVDIPPNGRLTVVTVGFLVDMRWLLIDDATAPPTDGTAKARVIHASLFAPSLDVATRTGEPLFPGTAFDEATPYRAFDARQYDLEIRPASQAGNVLLSSVTFAPNTAYSLYVLNATTVRAYVDAQAPTGGQPTAVREAPGPAATAVPATATAVAAIPPQLPAATLQPVVVVAASPLETSIPTTRQPVEIGMPATAVAAIPPQLPAATAQPVAVTPPETVVATVPPPLMMGIPATQRPAPTVPAAPPVLTMPVTGRGSSSPDGSGSPALVLGVLAGAMVVRVGVALRRMARKTLL